MLKQILLFECNINICNNKLYKNKIIMLKECIFSLRLKYCYKLFDKVY